MLKKFLKEIVVIVVGKHAEEIADLIDSKKHVNEFIIARKLDITINQTRNILYKLSDYGLVSSIRKRDKKKGWYTYFWKIEISKSLEFLKRALDKRIGQINNQIKNRESKEFYICKECNIEFNEENALTHNFMCNECGGIFSIKDNSKILRDLRRNLDKLEKELELVLEEVKKEDEKLDKIRLREIKKEEKLKIIKKKEAFVKRRLKMAEKKKQEGEKPVKKKVEKAAKKKSPGKTIKKKSKKKLVKKKAKPLKKK